MEHKQDGMDAVPTPKNPEDLINQLRELVGGDVTKGLIDGPPPIPVDRDRLLAYHSHEMSGREESLIEELISSYREWWDASLDVLREVAKEEGSDSGEEL